MLSILSILPNRPVSPSLDRERFVLFPQSLESSFLGLRRSRSRLTRALDLPGWSETKRKWNDTVRLKQSFQPNRSFLFRLDPNFDNFSAQKGNFSKWNGKFRSDDRTEGAKRTTSGGGPRWPENFPRTEAFHSILNRNFWHDGKHPRCSVSSDIQTTRSLSTTCIKISPQLCFATSGLSHWELKDFYFLPEGS